MKYFEKEHYDASMTPSIRKHWQFFVLAGAIYVLAALTALQYPFYGELSAGPVTLFAGTFLVKMAGYFIFGTVMLLSSRIPLMAPVMLLGWGGFYVALAKPVLLFQNGQTVLAAATLMLRFAYIFALLLCGSIIGWEETKAFLGERRKLFLPLKPKRETLCLLGCASALISLIETALL